MKAKDAARLSTLRMLLSAIRNEEINLRHALTDEEAQRVAAKQVKQMEDALADYRRGGRGDLVAQAQREVDTLQEFLPEQMSEAELTEIVQTTVAALGAQGANDIGRVMGAAMKEVKGRADGNRVRALVGKILSTQNSSQK